MRVARESLDELRGEDNAKKDGPRKTGRESPVVVSATATQANALTIVRERREHHDIGGRQDHSVRLAPRLSHAVATANERLICGDCDKIETPIAAHPRQTERAPSQMRMNPECFDRDFAGQRRVEGDARGRTNLGALQELRANRVALSDTFGVGDRGEALAAEPSLGAFFLREDG